MFKEKTHAALDLLANSGRGGVLHLDQPANSDSMIVREILVSKHPPSKPESPDSTLHGPPPEIHPIVFDSIDARLIRSTELRTSGAAGSSGLDAHSWWRLCTPSNRHLIPCASFLQKLPNVCVPLLLILKGLLLS